MNDPRMRKHAGPKKRSFGGSRMFQGGFKPIVSLQEVTGPGSCTEPRSRDLVQTLTACRPALPALNGPGATPASDLASSAWGE